MPFRATTQEIPRVSPLSRAQLKGYVPSHNSRNTSKPPLKHHQSLVDHAYNASNPMLLQQESPGIGHEVIGASTLRPPSGGRVPLGATCLKTH
ncbi:hypothetical protein DEO72_LG8g1799 [Vigna unguiculata]|uniref:Uncharacterized protein n=1 Tax=Vigna unguiculata TaxID=3917 RepID=A0A4D6MQS0_VIGUN|nr:hypothetical protein DEO72_LG8g1799 [Vigna unguiculata]